MAGIEVKVEGVEAQALTGWICPRCHSVHAPFISTCPVCDANKNPRAPAWLLRATREEIEAARKCDNIHGVYTTHFVETLVKAAEPK